MHYQSTMSNIRTMLDYRQLSRPAPLQALLVGAILVLSIALWRRYLSPLSKIPGPFLASFSRLWHVRRVFEGYQNRALLGQHRKHGHFVRIAHNEISVAHPDAVKKILAKSLEKAPWYKLLAFPDWRYQSPMSTTNPHKKKELSRLLASSYITSNLLKSEDAMDEQIAKLLGWMDQHADSQSPMHLDRFITYCAFDIVGEVLFSKPFGFIEQGVDIGDAIATSVTLNMTAAWGGFYRHIFYLLANPFMTWLNILPMGHLGDISTKALRERSANAEGARYDMVEHWLSTHRKQPGNLTFRDIESATSSTVGAGSDTVSCAVQSVIYFMIRHPGAWDRARAEIIRDAQQVGQQHSDGRGGGGGASRVVVPFSETTSLTYLQACIREALRIFPPVVMGLARQAPPGGLSIKDRHFPEGTTLSVSPFVLHHSKEIWGDDADCFRPERWLGEGEENGGVRASGDLERYWIPWGMGYNACPGQTLARIELTKLTATIIRDYDIRQVDPEQEWSHQAYFVTVPYDWPVYITKVS